MLPDCASRGTLTNAPILIFDLDKTPYPRGAGLMQEIGVRINRYLIENLHCPPIRRKNCEAYDNQHGTACAASLWSGAMRSRGYPHTCTTSPDRSHRPGPALTDMLRSIRLTSEASPVPPSSSPDVWRRIGIADQFEDIIDVRRGGSCEQTRSARYRRLDILGARGDECILIEDAVRNLLPAKALGMTTILVDSATAPKWITVCRRFWPCKAIVDAR